MQALAYTNLDRYTPPMQDASTNPIPIEWGTMTSEQFAEHTAAQALQSRQNAARKRASGRPRTLHGHVFKQRLPGQPRLRPTPTGSVDPNTPTYTAEYTPRSMTYRVAVPSIGVSAEAIDLIQPPRPEEDPAHPDFTPSPADNMATPTYRTLVKEFFRGLRRRQVVDFTQTMRERTIVAWRIARELARHYGLIANDERLIESNRLCSVNYDINDAWINPSAMPHNLIIDPKIPENKCFDLVRILVLAERISPEDMLDQFVECQMETSTTVKPKANGEPVTYTKRIKQPGLTILPPPVPTRFLDDQGYVTDEYEEEEDVLLMHYMEAVETIAEHLAIEAGSFYDRTLGRNGLYGLTDAYYIRETFPSPLQLIAMENLMIEQMLGLMVEMGLTQAKDRMQQLYGLTHHELHNLVKMARKQSLRDTDQSIDEARAMMVLKLEGLIRRAGEALNLREEHAALKTLSIVQGLGIEKHDNIVEEFIEAVNEAASKRARAGVRAAHIDNPKLLLEGVDAEANRIVTEIPALSDPRSMPPPKPTGRREHIEGAKTEVFTAEMLEN